MEQIDLEEMRPGEEQAVCDLVKQVFDALVAPGYEREGVEEFHRFAAPVALASRVASGGFVLLARRAEAIVGALEFAPPDRIAMLFVSQRGRGVAKALVASAIERAGREIPSLSKVTVHSSPYAETAYRKMGFRRTGDDVIEHGIRYAPMALLLRDEPES